ncbi:hypothetical protein P8452_71042 [Trifolium repens]|nr:hypothetical protein P8452_71042 [Trifolium repens]
MEGATNDTPPEPPMTHRQNRLKIKCRRCNRKIVLMKETLGSSSTNEVQFGEIPKLKKIDVHEFGGKQLIRLTKEYVLLIELISLPSQSNVHLSNSDAKMRQHQVNGFCASQVYCYVYCNIGLLEYR